MKKILKTQGSLGQWTKIIKLSMDQMGLQTLTEGNCIKAYYDNQPLICFQLNEKGAVFLSIDYLDERDLSDFKLTAANIYANYSKYADAVPIEDQNVPQGGFETETNPELDKESSLFPDEDEVSEPQEDPVVKKKKKSKGPIVALIIGLLLVLGVGGFFGYRYYQKNIVPAKMYEEALHYYNDLNDYDQAIVIAEDILANYPDSKSAADAQELLGQATAKRDEIAKQKAEEEAKKSGQNVAVKISSLVMDGPDEEGYIGLTLGFVNESDKVVDAATIGINFLDASGQAVVVDGAEEATLSCEFGDDTATGEANEGYWEYYSGDAASVKVVSINITYADGSTATVTDESEIAKILPQ